MPTKPTRKPRRKSSALYVPLDRETRAELEKLARTSGEKDARALVRGWILDRVARAP